MRKPTVRFIRTALFGQNVTLRPSEALDAAAMSVAFTWCTHKRIVTTVKCSLMPQTYCADCGLSHV